MPKGLSKIAPLIGFVLACGQCAAADLGSDEYLLPLFGNYAIRRADLNLPSQDAGVHQLVEVDRHLTSEMIQVTNLKQFAVSGRIILGTTQKGFFIFDTSAPNVEAKEFANADDWHAALQSAGVPTNIQLQDPDAVAATMSDQQIHPLDYRVMKGRLGLSDDEWSATIQLLGLVLIFLRGILVSSRSSPLLMSVLLAVVVNFVAQILIVGGGPGAFAGFFILPVLYWIVCEGGRLLRKWVWERRGRSGKTVGA